MGKLKQANVQSHLVEICDKRAKSKYRKELTETQKEVLSKKFKNYTKYLNFFQIDKILTELFTKGKLTEEVVKENPLIVKLKLALTERAKAYNSSIPDLIMINLIKSFGDIKKIPSKPVLDKKLVSFKLIEKDIKKVDSKEIIETQFEVTENVKAYENKTIEELKNILDQVGWEHNKDQTSKTYYLSQLAEYFNMSSK